MSFRMWGFYLNLVLSYFLVSFIVEKHQLFLDFPETTNEGVLRVEDASIYSSLIPFNCPTLEITPPGFTTPTVFTNLLQHYQLFLNACNLGILSTGCGDKCPFIDDGIYHFRYSISPNDKVFVEYNMLRIVHILNKWRKTLCWINDTPCDPTNDKLVLIREMQLIGAQIQTAKYLVEDKNIPEDGIQMYKLAARK